MTIAKKAIIIRSLALIAANMLLMSQAPAQIHLPEQPQNKLLTLAEERYQQGLYQASIDAARKFLSLNNDPVGEKRMTDKDKAQYYLALSLLKSDAKGCVDSATSYLAQTANPVYQQRVEFSLAQYFFRHDQLAAAIPYYEATGIANLSNHEIADAKFEQAYCYFNSKQFDKAEAYFATIKEIDGKYKNAGNYYYALLAYHKGEYDKALKSFQRIDELPEYKSIVPYYIAEIYYFTGNREKALSEAKRLINRKEKLYYDKELHLLAAQCLFEQEQYAQALPFFEYYYDNSTRVRKEELYEMAYCYYQVHKWSQAIDNFKELSSAKDSLGQTSMYLLGDCYIKTGDRKSARNAFGICSDMNFNPGQREASLLLAGKLSYEMGFNDEATRRIGTLISEYPESPYRSEAKTIFSDLLAKTNNYSEAYRTLQDVPNQDENFRRVMQRVAYGYAMQQMQAGEFASADNLLTIAASNAEDPVFVAAANFWKGDIAFRDQRFADAIYYTDNFLNKPESYQKASYLSQAATQQNAYMNMGYAAMKQQDFASAQLYFGKARQQSNGSVNTGMNATAVLREADAAFMSKQYATAASLYDKVIAANNSDADYARFQKSILLGLQNKTNEKVALLQSLINRTPASMYASDARYELALTYIELDKYQQALAQLQPLTERKDNSKLTPKALLKTGFVYQQMDNNAKATESYRQLVTDYPSAPERGAALDALKGLYVQAGNPEAYAQLLKDNNISLEDNNSLDSTFYNAAEEQFGSGKYAQAAQAFDQYLKTYPNGAFVVKAHYYKAESYLFMKNEKDALPEYDAVLATNWNDFSDNSARKAAQIAYRNGDFAAATNYYTILRNNAMDSEHLEAAYQGLMRSSFKNNQQQEALQYADTLLSLPGVQDASVMEANFYKAKSLQAQNNLEDAIALYQVAIRAKDGAIAAESRYRVAEIYLQQGNLKEAEKAAGATIQQSGGQDYWIVKAYLALSDILVRQKDYFNAKATLQSVIKNTKFADLKQEAQKKLETVKGLEKTKSKLTEE